MPQTPKFWKMTHFLAKNGLLTWICDAKGAPKYFWTFFLILILNSKEKSMYGGSDKWSTWNFWKSIGDPKSGHPLQIDPWTSPLSFTTLVFLGGGDPSMGDFHYKPGKIGEFLHIIIAKWATKNICALFGNFRGICYRKCTFLKFWQNLLLEMLSSENFGEICY